jgi:hypothetical protein
VSPWQFVGALLGVVILVFALTGLADRVWRGLNADDSYGEE